MKGTTHAKIDVMKGFAVVAFVAGCSSVQLQHIIAELDRENRAGHSPVDGEQSTGKNLDQAKVTPSLPPTPFLKVSKITSPITFMGLEEI